ncbi:hypothetical protein EDD15DRAFT_2202516 [Pisolithus albus]|nr:hypothetical protein EDD15DRAFT_2202516 [Pisolithus albus]
MKSVALRDLCVTGYYIGKSSLAASFSDIFSKHFPTGALAFAATALTAAMDKYATGALIAIKFCHEGYSKVNEQFLEIIANIEAVPHHFRSLQGVLKNIAVQGCAKNLAIGVGSTNSSVPPRKASEYVLRPVSPESPSQISDKPGQPAGGLEHWKSLCPVLARGGPFWDYWMPGQFWPADVQFMGVI